MGTAFVVVQASIVAPVLANAVSPAIRFGTAEVAEVVLPAVALTAKKVVSTWRLKPGRPRRFPSTAEELDWAVTDTNKLLAKYSIRTNLPKPRVRTWGTDSGRA